jgi:hypothetical protein
MLRHEALQLAEEWLVGTGVPISADESQVAQQGAADEFLLRQQVKCPAALLGKQSHGSEFSGKRRSIETIGGFDFEKPRFAVEHVDQEVRDNVRATAVLLIPGAKSFVVLQQFNPKLVSIVTPLIPDGHWLLLHMSHGGARYQDGRSRRFELAMTGEFGRAAKE